MSAIEEINEKLAEETGMSLSSNQYLTFLLDIERFAMPVIRIREIIEYGDLTVVPTAPRIYRGVINLRGRIVPVIDLVRQFGLKESPVTKRTCIIVMDAQLEGEEVTIGCMVDKVLLVQDILPEQIDQAPDLGTVIDARFVKGMGKVDNNFITILHIDHIFSQSEIVCGQQIIGSNDNGQGQVRV